MTVAYDPSRSSSILGSISNKGITLWIFEQFIRDVKTVRVSSYDLFSTLSSDKEKKARHVDISAGHPCNKKKSQISKTTLGDISWR